MSSFVQGNSATSGGTQTNIVSAAFSSNNAAGNFLVCAVRYFVISIGGGITGVTDSQGNTWVRANGSYQDGASDFVSSWYATNCKAGANTVTFTGGSSSAFPRICIAVYRTTLPTARPILQLRDGHSGNHRTEICRITISWTLWRELMLSVELLALRANGMP